MKISLIPAILSTLPTAALTFWIYNMNSSDEYAVLLTVGTALTFLLTLGACLSVSLPDSRDTINLKVWSGTMFLLVGIAALCFAGLGVNLSAYVVIETLLLTIHLLVIWKFVS